MKYLILAITTSVLLLCGIKVRGQVNNDSLRIQSIRKMCGRFNLSDSAITAAVGATKKMIESVALLSKRSPSPEEGTSSMSAIQSEYEQQLKGILTADQWRQYQQSNDSTRQKFLERMKTKNIHVKEL